MFLFIIIKFVINSYPYFMNQWKVLLISTRKFHEHEMEHNEIPRSSMTNARDSNIGLPLGSQEIRPWRGGLMGGSRPPHSHIFQWACGRLFFSFFFAIHAHAASKDKGQGPRTHSVKHSQGFTQLCIKAEHVS